MKAFLSSTYEDLKEHRRLVILTLQRLGIPFEAMELFGARAEPPIDVALDTLRACDFYVGIFGTRYGSLDSQSGLSITEAEYRESQRLNLPSLIYLIDEEMHRVAPKQVDRGESAERLERLKQDLRANHTVSFFASAHELAWQISLDLPALVNRGVHQPRPERPSVVDAAGVKTERQPVGAEGGTSPGAYPGVLSLAVHTRESSEPEWSVERGNVKQVATTSTGATLLVDVALLPDGIPADRGLKGYQFDFVYDPDVVRIVALDESPYLGKGPDYLLSLSMPIPDKSGRFQVAAGILGEGHSDGPGVLAQLTIEAISVGSTLLNLSNIVLVDSQYGEIGVDELIVGTLIVEPT